MMVGRLTTTDNPWNPFDNWDEWFTWDSKAGYHSSGLLARFLANSDELSEIAQQEITNEAIMKVVEDNFSGVHTVVWRDLPHPFPESG